MDKKELTELTRLHSQGLTDKEILIALGVSKSTVRRHRELLGLPINRDQRNWGGKRAGSGRPKTWRTEDQVKIGRIPKIPSCECGSPDYKFNFHPDADKGIILPQAKCLKCGRIRYFYTEPYKWGEAHYFYEECSSLSELDSFFPRYGRREVRETLKRVLRHQRYYPPDLKLYELSSNDAGSEDPAVEKYPRAHPRKPLSDPDELADAYSPEIHSQLSEHNDRRVDRLKSDEIQCLFQTAYYDQSLAEIISLMGCKYLDVKKGDVLLTKRGYIHPELEDLPVGKGLKDDERREIGLTPEWYI